MLSALNAHTAGSVEPSALTLRGTAASFVKIEPGLWEGSHDFCCVLTPPASRLLDVGHCDRTGYKYILIEWRGVGPLLGGIACRNECSIRCVHAYSLFTAWPVRVPSELFTCRQAGTGQTDRLGRSLKEFCRHVQQFSNLLLVNPRCTGEIGISKIGTVCYASPASRHSSDPGERYRQFG